MGKMGCGLEKEMGEREKEIMEKEKEMVKVILMKGSYPGVFRTT